jgi:Putative adhesin
MRFARHLLAAILVMLLPCVVSAQNSSGTENPFHWKGKLAAGKSLSIKDVSGDITAETASGDEVEVTATKHGRGADAVHIDVAESGDGIAICAIFPSGDGGSASNCTPDSEWHVSTHGNNNNARVDFTVRLPRNVRFVGRDVNGSVKAKNLGEIADVTTVNGSVDVDTDQWARLSTVNGSVSGHFGKADWSNELNISTVNGDITLEVPADLSTDVEFSAVNGSLNSDLALTVQSQSGRYGPKHVSGTIGSGGRELKLHTVNGSVNLHKNTL